MSQDGRGVGGGGWGSKYPSPLQLQYLSLRHLSPPRRYLSILPLSLTLCINKPQQTGADAAAAAVVVVVVVLPSQTAITPNLDNTPQPPHPTPLLFLSPFFFLFNCFWPHIRSESGKFHSGEKITSLLSRLIPN